MISLHSPDSHAMLRDILEPRLKQYQADVASFPLRTQSRILRSVDVDVATVEDIQMLSSVGARAVAAFESPTEI